jgi:CBS domain-containing protein
MKAKEIMTPSPCFCSSESSIQAVAELMRVHDCGSVPVIDADRVVGIVTDRDLAIRALAVGKGPNITVGEVMTAHPNCCEADDDVRDVEKIMTDNQVRRVPVIDAAGRCIGIISQADLARAALDGDHVSEHEVAIVVEAISTPARQPIDRGSSSELEQRL